MSEDQAHKVMITAHRRGVCVVAVFTKDVAETKATRATDAGRAKGYPLLFTTEQPFDLAGAGVSDIQPDHLRRRVLDKASLSEVRVLRRNNEPVLLRILPDLSVGTVSRPTSRT